MSGLLPLDDPRTDQLRRIHAALIERFGRIVRPPDKRRSPEWTLVQGVVGAQTRTAISNRSTDALLERYGSWDAVADVPVEELEAMLVEQTFPRVSAERLLACFNAIREQRGSVTLTHLSNQPTEEAMAWLEALPGVARKISAQVMNTSTFNRPVMVIEGHHRRTMARLGLVPEKADTLRCYQILMPVFPPEWTSADMDEHHLLLKKLGQNHCRPRFLDCPNCPVLAECRTGAERVSRAG
ncbi:endonuclease III domain-containing protein [Alteraurantiacibacter aquimixticola]|uniref:Endonuclease III n=1 Tax=Alteraurantiacibacter aquimixticola TaxID=2489173 RepID=A0A4T3EWN9_9SPHN|nr:endonuclease III [Alteraurantiacibacter aquimixticola]TIX48893.1 endonuclease III [Alteraurantiacibacter aquimixticola]